MLTTTTAAPPTIRASLAAEGLTLRLTGNAKADVLDGDEVLFHGDALQVAEWLAEHHDCPHHLAVCLCGERHCALCPPHCEPGDLDMSHEALRRENPRDVRA